MQKEQHQPFYNTKTAEKDRNSDRALLNSQKNVKTVYAHNKTATNSLLMDEPQSYTFQMKHFLDLDSISNEISFHILKHETFEHSLVVRFLSVVKKLLNCKYICIEARNFSNETEYSAQSEPIQSKNIEKLVQRTIKKVFESHEPETCRNNKEAATAIGSYIDSEFISYKICVVYVFNANYTIQNDFKLLQNIAEQKMKYFLELFIQTNAWNSRDYYIKQIIDTIPEGIIMRNTVGKVIFYNQVALKLTHNYLELCKNPSIEPFWDSYDLDNIQIDHDKTPSIRALKNNEEIHGEIIQIIPYDSDKEHKIQIYVSAAPIHGPLKEVLGSVVIFQNLSSVLQSQKILQTLMEGLNHRLANINQVLISESEVIKKEISELFEQNNSQNDQRVITIKKHFDIVERKTLELVESINDFNNYESHHIKDTTYYCSLRTVIHNFVQTQKHSNPNRQITLVGNAGDSQINGLWNSAIIHTVLENLIGNALKYSNGDIKVYLEKQQDTAKPTFSALISVTDYGDEIPFEEREKIFEPKYRGNSTKNSKFGLGKGLAICKSLVQSLKGSITYNRLDNKNVFSVTLPIRSV